MITRMGAFIGCGYGFEVGIAASTLTLKGPKSWNGFFGSLGKLSRHQKHEWVFEIFEEGGPM
jgi:hypothetical protein